ncbi:MAG: NYN domain-containing protein [Minisyncoccia bacterium]
MDQNSTPSRIVVFIDGSNFYHKLKEVLCTLDDSYKMLGFKYKDFFQNLAKESPIVEIRYYVGVIKRQAGPDIEKSEKMYSQQQRLIARLQKENIVVTLGNLIQHPDKSFHEKGVDVRLAVEMIRLAREDRYDVAYLVSSDTDMVPAVEEAQSFNKKVVYIGRPKGQSFGLTKASDDTILLREDEIIPYFPREEVV